LDKTVQTQAKEEIATLNPIFDGFELPLRATLYPVGFPLEIVTNSEEVIEAARESWGAFRKSFSTPAIRLRIGVLDGNSEECSPIPLCRAQRNLLINVADAENFTVCDLHQGFAFGWVTRATAKNRAFLRYYFLEGTVWCLQQDMYLTPIHGACVQLGERGVLLCGDSGAGKSSLALACALRGWTFLSDDSSSLVRGRKDLIVVGNPYQMRFRESALSLFPELRTQCLARRITGEMAIELATADLPQISTATECPVDHIVFLNRKDPGPPRLLSYPKEKALKWFEQVVRFGDPTSREAQRTSLRQLVKAEVLEMRYRELNWAVDQLELLVRDGARPRHAPSPAESLQDNA